jgi:hypothetical protein
MKEYAKNKNGMDYNRVTRKRDEFDEDKSTHQETFVRNNTGIPLVEALVYGSAFSL